MERERNAKLQNCHSLKSKTQSQQTKTEFPKNQKICSHSLLHAQKKDSQNDFSALHTLLTKDIHQYAHKMEIYQKQKVPLFDFIFGRIKNLIVDFFKTNIEVD